MLFRRLACTLHHLIPPLASAFSRPYLVSVRATSSTWGLKKQRVKNLEKARVLNKMATNNDAEATLAPLRSSVKEQGDYVRSLKENKGSDNDLARAIAELKLRKRTLEDKELELAKPASGEFDRAKMEDLIKRRFYYEQSFSIYGGIQGLYDFGPMGCAIKSNFLAAWRKHFILEEHMLEVDTTCVTPEPVLKASGHVDRFLDYMVKDVKTGDCYRVDHLIKANLEEVIKDKKTAEEDKNKAAKLLGQLDNLDKQGFADAVTSWKMKSPITGNDLSEPVEFNLMFGVSIGPTGLIRGFLRPETAQGIFVNFKRLLEFNQGKLPFACAQIGNAYRNEISPRSGLLRVREFTMAEIEHFVDPSNKDHPKFENVKELVLTWFSACNQMDGQAAQKVAVGKAVADKLIANQTLAYFVSRIYLFLVKVGVDPSRIRFRQHLSNEMAHYACDCWDAEILTSYGWVECVGCADRSAYDLTQHTKATGISLVAEKPLPAPVTVDVVEVIPNRALIGKTFGKSQKKVLEHLSVMPEKEILAFEEDLKSTGASKLTIGGEELAFTKEMAEIKRSQKTKHVDEFTPGVIEPSFGVGRIIYAILEHNFRTRPDDEQRTLFALPPVIAPLKCSVLPLSSNPGFQPLVKQISEALTLNDISHKIDDSSGSIGRRYARADEISIPFGITIDFDTLNNQPTTVTLRDRDSMEQIRIGIDEVVPLIVSLVNGRSNWDAAVQKYPKFTAQETTGKKD
ncbi:Glycine--tRNA ligase [Hypsibius exemplaris]|uniref:Glycine--tRNA ligase n=1 Tax=Hypsibius exemplaris TaxID=2072580 RepID=A0A1W0WIQ1_HYPEX|nr:Glycine--tRNA ligase [Hypsibius exemplaris]